MSDELLAYSGATFCTDPGPPSLTINGPHGPLVTIRPDGTIIYGVDYTPDDAARIFWEALAGGRCKGCGRALEVGDDV